MNLEDYFDRPRVKIYTHFPYGRDGSQVDEVASWTSGRGLSVRSGHQLFPEKFENFHGAKVGVTALPFRPYWIEEETKAPDGALQKTYSGSDGLLLTTIAGALNFSFAVLPVAGWGEVTSLVMERKSMMAAIYHILLPQRQERYDFTFTYEQIKTDFCMATPSLGSNWQSLYYPLSHGVWASVLAMLVVFSFVLYVVTNVFCRDDIQRLRSWGVTEVVLGSLLGQSIVQRTASSSGYRVLVATWLIFAFIVGTAYRGNLTAALTLPAYPPRPETIAQLVKAVESVTMPSYGTEFRNFFLQSESFEFKTLGAQMVIVPSALDGLRQALVKKQSHMDGRRYLDQMIAEHFTDARGEAQLYVGRQSVLPGLAGWPVPHDAPYKPQLDRIMMRIIEAGLYEKWSEDMLRQAREEGRQKEKERMEKQKLDGEQVEDEEANKSDKAKALNIVHMQGPLMLLLLGLLLGLLVFASELVVGGKTWP
ncbi:Variant Ionotropic Glutamate Receptor [Penaeus vannamei]|uniref:Variant Ionotropic Glutamate Receptor n=1 Tax=Penaeus vannamei TaxID=6689 RepID=A0A3R7QE71_PENVA|nr:Variant Ionotropic Glutamate Receptor [Penaeus vannamei]